jgi:predicted transcriptional regulator/transcriptional regulator with XRE-family HTH domain
MTDLAPARLGNKVRALRRQSKISQGELASRLGISASYLNLIENNHRPLPAALLIRLAQLFQVQLSSFDAGEDARLSEALFEAFSDPLFEEQDVPANDVRELAASSPPLARAVMLLYRAFLGARDSADALSSQLSSGDQDVSIGRSHVSSEEVSDVIQQHLNHFPELEAAAEQLWRDAELSNDDLYAGLVRHLSRAHGVTVRTVRTPPDERMRHHYDPQSRLLSISELLPNRSRKMQLAYQLGLLSLESELERLLDSPLITGDESRALGRAALANYFAAAVLMPYEAVLRAAVETRYDIEVIGRRFGTGFEQVAHRLTTLSRPAAAGVPFHMIRIDIAGNISKRFSASGIAIARFSGACPRWNVFSAFLTPGMLRVQLSRMPDGASFFCIARTVQADSQGYHTPPRIHAVGLGCALRHARELVYADGLDLTNSDAVVPVGLSCRVCERTTCEQRAFPSVHRPLSINANRRGVSLYAPPSAEREPSAPEDRQGTR